MSLKAELKALLEKYNCSIYVDMDECSDANGVYGVRTELVENMTEKVLVAVDGWGIEACDLKE